MQSKIIGYLHILVQTLKANEGDKDIKANISLGQIAKVDTTVKKSGSAWNQVFMIEVPSDPARLSINCISGQEKIGQCRYDVNPFFKHQGMAHTIESDLYDEENHAKGQIKLKVTFYSSQHGKLKIRIFHLSLIEQFVQKFKNAKVKVRAGIYAQSTPTQSLSQQFDHTVDLIILQPTNNLTFDVVNEQGILATYTIYNIQKSGLLIKQPKAYQVSLFNNDKGVGMIKYKLDWILDQ